MRSLLFASLLLAVPTLASAQVLYQTDFENGAYGDLNGQLFDGGAWTVFSQRVFDDNSTLPVLPGDMSRPWAEIIGDPTGDGRGKILRYLPEDISAQRERTTSWVGWSDKNETGFQVIIEGEYYVQTQALPVFAADGPLGRALAVEDATALLNSISVFSTKADGTGANQGEYWYHANDSFNLQEGPDVSPGSDFWNGAGGPVPLDQWFTVRRVLTYDGSGSEGFGTYDFYVNNVKVAEGLSLVNDTLGGLKMIPVLWGDPAWNPEGAFYVSDLRVSERELIGVPEPSVFMLGGLGLLGLLARRRRK